MDYCIRSCFHASLSVRPWIRLGWSWCKCFALLSTSCSVLITWIIQLKIGYIYGGLCALTGVFVWACIGETRGKSLETINNFFIHQVPARKWSDFDLAQDWKDPLAVDAAREYQLQRKTKGDLQPVEERLEKVGSNTSNQA